MSENLPVMALPDPVEPEDPLVGLTVDGRYLIERKLGEGGMGVVYKIKHVVLQKDLAMKILRSDVSRDQEIITRFRQEAQSASAIGSQHIIDISDFGTLKDGATYFVMEYLDGTELSDVAEGEETVPAERVIHIAKQLCDALGAAHERGIVHRDMKPDNVFLVKRGSNPDFVKVLDFGIAKVGGANSKLTKAGQVFGTPHYMSPEQCSGQSVDQRTDIYAVGVILYELACGRVPFDADNLMGILTKHIYEQPIPPHQLPPPHDVPPGLEAVILKALAKSVDQRYQSMAEMRADLDLLSEGETPGAVLDAVKRNTAPLIRPDGTGGHPAITMGIGGEAPVEGSKAPIILGAVVGLVALLATGAAVYFFALAPDDPAPIVEAEPEPPPEPDPPPVVEPPPVAEVADGEGTGGEAEPVVAMITVVSEPVGVEVWVVDASAGETLAGNTPFELPRPPAGQFVNLVLKQPGFTEHPIRVGQFTSEQVSVTLHAGSTGNRGGGRRRGPATNNTPPVETPPATQETPPARRRGGGIGSEVLDPWAR